MTQAPALLPRKQPSTISSEEMEKRRLLIRKVDHENLVEGVKRPDDSDWIFQSYINGEIEVGDMAPLLATFRGR